MLNVRGLALSLLLALPLVAGCKQGVNERCQLDSDCDDGLTCVIPQSVPLSEGGTCQPQNVTDASVVDEAQSTGDQGASVDMSLAADAEQSIDQATIGPDLAMSADTATPADLTPAPDGSTDL